MSTLKKLTKTEVKKLKTKAVKRGKPTSETIQLFHRLEVGEGFTTNKNKSLQIRLQAFKSGKKVSIRNLGNNSYLVERKA
jgi:hypothetical protein